MDSFKKKTQNKKAYIYEYINVNKLSIFFV